MLNKAFLQPHLYIIKTNIISFRNGFNSFGITLCDIAIVMYRMVLKNGNIPL